ncbi:hypothetical protein WJX74_010444 [Apatococcus lobatus]|uniref:Endonuclease/exonuclease/phosphatase domain-containing protein n=1 Tax=Apatococcus lobatus TaxID=904363 RepID=A0AAW1SAN0_9CHLO
MRSDLPGPGQLLFHDCRPQQRLATDIARPVRLLQWNIERGYQLPKILAELREIDADVIALQEVDIGCDRSGSADTGLEIAQALQLNYVFFCEFEELHSPARDARSQGGGVHGNAFLSRFDIHDARIIQHR